MTVGFIGLGNMGAHMARNLLRAGRRVVVNDVSADAMRSLEKAGAIVAGSPSAVAAAIGCGSLITMLPSSRIVRDVYAEALGAPSFSAKLLIDCSTVDPSTAVAVAGWAAEAQAAFVDAPVSGGVVGAEAATLTFMAGAADDAAFGAAEGVLSLMGKSVVRCGGVGAGQAVKLCNNLALGVSMAGIAEAMLLGTRLGVEPATLAAVFNSSSARCWSSDTYNPCPGVMAGVPASRDYEGGFGTTLMLKDLRLAAEAASAAGTPVPSCEHATRMYKASADAGMGAKDFGAVYKFLADQKPRG